MNEFVKKLSSGKFFSTVLVVTTYCLIMLGLVGLTIIGKITTEVFLGTLVGFASLSGQIIEGYFHKQKEQ